MRLKVLAAASFILIFSSASHCEDALGLKELILRAIENNDMVLMARESALISQRDVDKAYSMLFPSLTVEGQHTKYTEEKTGAGFTLQPEDSSRLEFSARQLVYGGGREWSYLRQAKKTSLSKEIGVEDIRLSVALDTALAYYAFLKASKTLEINRAGLKRAEEQMRVSRARFKAGAVTKSDVLRAEALAAEKTALLVKAELSALDAFEALKRITAIEGPFEVKKEEGLIPARPVFSSASGDGSPAGVDELIEIALKNRHDYRQMELAEETAVEGIRYAKGGFLPSVWLEGIYSLRDQTPKTTFFLEDSAYASLTVSIPIFEGGLRVAELAQARARAKEAELERIALRRDIELDLRRSYNNMTAMAAVMAAHEKEVEFAKENYSMVFKQYENGLAAPADLIDAETELTSAELNLMAASYDYQSSAVTLKRAAAILLKEIIHENEGP